MSDASVNMQQYPHDVFALGLSLWLSNNVEEEFAEDNAFQTCAKPLSWRGWVDVFICFS